MFNSSYLLFIFISINWFLIFTPIFNFLQFNWYLIFTSFITLTLILNHPFIDGLEFGTILNIDSYGLLISSLLTILFIGYLYTLFNTSVSAFKELPLLLLIIYFGFNTLIVSNDLIILYLSIELFSLTFYLITTIHQNYYTTEAGIKYFIYNFLAGAFYLLGCALIYSEICTFNFIYLIGFSMDNIGNIGWIFIIISFLFKLSVAPFHFWTPDVYQGVLYPITAFFTIFPKFVITTFMVKLYVYLFSSINSLNYLFLFCGVLSIFIGGFGALTQYNIKRLFAYSTILNSGFLITLISLGTPNSSRILMLYILTYVIANLGLFTMLTNLNISNMLGLKKIRESSVLKGILLSLPVLSLAGLPPFIGFIAKFLTIYIILGNNLIIMAIYTLGFSIISLFYYLRFVHYGLLYEKGEVIEKEEKRPTIYQSYIIILVNILIIILTINPSLIFVISSIYANTI